MRGRRNFPQKSTNLMWRTRESKYTPAEGEDAQENGLTRHFLMFLKLLVYLLCQVKSNNKDIEDHYPVTDCRFSKLSFTVPSYNPTVLPL